MNQIPPAVVRTGGKVSFWTRFNDPSYPRVARICVACDDSYDVPAGWPRTCYCTRCYGEAAMARTHAMQEVWCAIKLGRLMRADQFRCCDCSSWARCWEHRDYYAPLTVEPVCQSCNMKRPPAYRRKPEHPMFLLLTERRRRIGFMTGSRARVKRMWVEAQAGIRP